MHCMGYPNVVIIVVVHLEDTLKMIYAWNHAFMMLLYSSNILKKRLAGICSTYVDDTLHARPKEYQELKKQTEENSFVRNVNGIQFSGLPSERSNEMLVMNQNQHI